MTDHSTDADKPIMPAIHFLSKESLRNGHISHKSHKMHILKKLGYTDFLNTSNVLPFNSAISKPLRSFFWKTILFFVAFGFALYISTIFANTYLIFFIGLPLLSVLWGMHLEKDLITFFHLSKGYYHKKLRKRTENDYYIQKMLKNDQDFNYIYTHYYY